MFRQALLAATPLALVLALAGCDKPAPAPTPAPEPTPAPVTPPTPATDTTPTLALSGEGLQLVSGGGSTALVPFGGSQDSTIKSISWALEATAGAPTVNEECPSGPLTFVEWPGGLTALFEDGKFVGWSLGHGDTTKITTVAGIGLGSTRAQLVAATPGTTIEETSLGQEFASGDIYGILDGSGPNAKIDALWGGTSCVFR